jgi:polyribonucleotide nucleotidyltransferase
MSMFKKVSKTFQWGQNTVTMETGEIARQSTGAVLLDMDGTVVLATVVAKTEGKAGRTSSRSRLITLKRPTLRARFPAVFSSAKAAPASLRR